MSETNETAPERDELSAARVVDDRYRLERVIGGGGQGQTFVARDLVDQTDVLVKRFCVEATDDWKAVELFDRAATVLQSLDHRAVPAYRDHFEIELDGSVELYLVRELVPGERCSSRWTISGHLFRPSAPQVRPVGRLG
ncbi:MAG: hypothetical protein ACQEVA_14945 [Myxococcota bacterium]